MDEFALALSTAVAETVVIGGGLVGLLIVVILVLVILKVAGLL